MNQCLSQQRAGRNFALYFHWLVIGSDTPLEKAPFFFPSKVVFFFFFFFFLFPFSLTSFSLLYKRKVELFQILRGSEIFAFHSAAQNTENLLLWTVWSSNPQNAGSNFEGLCGWNVPAALAEPLKHSLNGPGAAAQACCHSWIVLFTKQEAEHCYSALFNTFWFAYADLDRCVLFTCPEQCAYWF